jgi:hypothetical protein
LGGIADNQDKEFKHKELTAKIIEFFYNKLGYGFLEGVEVGLFFDLVLNRELTPPSAGKESI